MTIRSTAARFIGASTLAVAAFAAQPALAQDAAATGAEDAGAGQLNTIIVTANRREENLQDVAVSAATLDSSMVKTIFDAGAEVTALAARVPGLFVESSNGRARLNTMDKISINGSAIVPFRININAFDLNKFICYLQIPILQVHRLDGGVYAIEGTPLINWLFQWCNDAGGCGITKLL